MFQVTLGIPSDFKGFSAGNPSSQVWVGDILDPALVGLVEGSSFDPVDATVDRKQPMLEWFAALSFFGQTRRLDLSERAGEALFSYAQR